MNAKQDAEVNLTERDLLSDFDKVQEMLRRFEDTYKVLPDFPEQAAVFEQSFVTEAIFSYRIHSSL